MYKIYEKKEFRWVLLRIVLLCIYAMFSTSVIHAEIEVTLGVHNAEQPAFQYYYTKNTRKSKIKTRKQSFSFYRWFDDWFGSDAPPMTNAELEGIVCAVAATSAAVLIIVFGGAVMTLEGEMLGATEKAITLPIIIPSMWGACAVGKTSTPGIIWMYRRSKELMKRLTPPGYTDEVE
ncbi:hypothetical protein TI05_06450 [Achromatium sp. WMS3]|nr:hypothetical protein TI05_06450 [Achromatium sp. WMS3]